MASGRHVIKLSAINEFCDKKIFEKGENALESGSVQRVTYDSTTAYLNGKVQAKMKKCVYDVEISLDKQGGVKEAKCTCPRGIKCHHIAAVLLFGHYNISVTDVECQWNVVKTDIDKLQTAEELFPPPKPYSAVERVMSEEEIEGLREKLENLGTPVGFTWLLMPEDPYEEETEWLPAIEEVLNSAECVQTQDKINFIKTKCMLSTDLIEKIAEATRGQRHNKKWFNMKKYRITASNFGPVLKAHRKNRFSESLFKTLLGLYDLQGIKPVQWGVTHEATALAHFENIFGEQVTSTGIWLSTSGVLGASPDGLVGRDSIVEVKCPYTYREKFLTTELINPHEYVIYFDEDGNVHVNEQHHIYDQIQGQLYLTNREKCHLVCWTTKETVTVIIERNEAWRICLQELEDFYFKKFLPKVLNL